MLTRQVRIYHIIDGTIDLICWTFVLAWPNSVPDNHHSKGTYHADQTKTNVLKSAFHFSLQFFRRRKLWDVDCWSSWMDGLNPGVFWCFWGVGRMSWKGCHTLFRKWRITKVFNLNFASQAIRAWNYFLFSWHTKQFVLNFAQNKCHFRQINTIVITVITYKINVVISCRSVLWCIK